MKEIKFRAWDKNTLKWRDDVCITTSGTPQIIRVSNELNKIINDYYAEKGLLLPGDYGEVDYTDWYAIEHVVINRHVSLKDKNDKEIFYDDILRIKGLMGDKGEYQYDALFKVGGDLRKGITLSFIRRFSEDPNSTSNCYPIDTEMSFYYQSLDVDYANQKYDHLVVKETWEENLIHRTRWKKHHYTNDIEIIGNIHENAELLNQQP